LSEEPYRNFPGPISLDTFFAQQRKYLGGGTNFHGFDLKQLTKADFNYRN
jgi:hypothetical protein